MLFANVVLIWGSCSSLLDFLSAKNAFYEERNGLISKLNKTVKNNENGETTFDKVYKKQLGVMGRWWRRAAGRSGLGAEGERWQWGREGGVEV